MSLKCLDLFSGIGGMALGLERAGLETIAFCEIEPYCQRVLKKHWPGVPCYNDVTKLTAEQLYADGIIRGSIDVIAGGFPCQDLSYAGKGAGIAGTRSGLWSEIARLVGEIRPGHVIVENVPALLARGMSRVLGDLSSLGYDAEWRTLRAWDFGFSHKRERIFIIAYPQQSGLQGRMRQATEEWRFTPRERIKALPEDTFWRDLPEPVVFGGRNGVSDRVGRSQGCGNAVVPAVAQYVGQCVVRHAEHVLGATPCR